MGRGKKFARLAAGGTIYILVIVAGLNRRMDMGNYPHELVNAIGAMLCDPSRAKEVESKGSQRFRTFAERSSDQRKLLISSLIPTISRMRAEQPFQFQFGDEQPLDCADIKASDRLFGRLKMRYVFYD